MVPGTLQEVRREPGAPAFSQAGRQVGGAASGLRVQGIERDLLFCALVSSPHAGLTLARSWGLRPHCFRGSHSASHPPRAVEIGVLCGLLAGSGPLGLEWEGSCGEPAPGWGIPPDLLAGQGTELFA